MSQGNGNGELTLARTLFDCWLRVWREERWKIRIDRHLEWRGATYVRERVVVLNPVRIAEGTEPDTEILLHEIGGHAMQRLDDTPAAEHLLVERISKIVYPALDARRLSILANMVKRASRQVKERE